MGDESDVKYLVLVLVPVQVQVQDWWVVAVAVVVRVVRGLRVDDDSYFGFRVLATSNHVL